MNLFDQISNIDEYIEKLKLRDSQDILLASGFDLNSAGLGLGSSGLVWAKEDSVLRNDPNGSGLVWADPDSVLKNDPNGSGLVWADPDSVLKVGTNNDEF